MQGFDLGGLEGAEEDIEGVAPVKYAPHHYANFLNCCQSCL